MRSLNILLLIASALSFVHAEQTRNAAVTRALADGPHHAADYIHSHNVTTSYTIVEAIDTDSGDAKAVSHSSVVATRLCSSQSHECTAPAHKRLSKYPRPQGRAPPTFA